MGSTPSLEVIRCSSCSLNQYITRDGKCRKCSNLLKPIPLPVRIQIGMLIRWFRKEKGFTQSELSNLSGLKRVMISRYERVEMSPTVDSITKLSKAFGVSPQIFMTMADTIHV